MAGLFYFIIVLFHDILFHPLFLFAPFFPFLQLNPEIPPFSFTFKSWKREGRVFTDLGRLNDMINKYTNPKRWGRKD